MKRILIIDDDKMLNKIHEKVLLAAGVAHELDIKTNGLDALNYLKYRISNNHLLPEIIILDLHMPVMNGLQFLDEFQKLDFPGKHEIEFVVFTSSTSVRDKQNAISRGIKHYLSKPYILRGLVDIISKLDAGRNTLKLSNNPLR